MSSYDLTVPILNHRPKGAPQTVLTASTKKYVPEYETPKAPTMTGRDTNELLSDETKERIDRLRAAKFRCQKCKQEFPRESFYKVDSRPSGVSACCISCVSKDVSQRRAKEARRHGTQGDPATTVDENVHETPPWSPLLTHGLLGTCTKHQCRCEDCRAAKRRSRRLP